MLAWLQGIQAFHSIPMVLSFAHLNSASGGTFARADAAAAAAAIAADRDVASALLEVGVTGGRWPLAVALLAA